MHLDPGSVSSQQPDKSAHLALPHPRPAARSIARARHAADPRGVVVIVNQWAHEHGPCAWFLERHGVGAQGAANALRTAARHLADCPISKEHVTRSVWVREAGAWVPA